MRRPVVRQPVELAHGQKASMWQSIVLNQGIWNPGVHALTIYCASFNDLMTKKKWRLERQKPCSLRSLPLACIPSIPNLLT